MTSPFKPQSFTRRVQARSGIPLGFLPSVRSRLAKLAAEIDGISLRMNKPIPPGEPAGARGQRVFNPEATTFLFDPTQANNATIAVQYVVRDGMTYDIPVIFPPPGVFRARYLKVHITQRVYRAGVVQNVPVYFGQVQQDAIWSGVAPQTRKFSYGGSATMPPRISFLWNLVDTKSGNALSDQLMPDSLLLPNHGMRGLSTAEMSAGSVHVDQGHYEFDVPWLFERDAQLAFMFRPIMPMIQPSAATTNVWALPVTNASAAAFDDRENGQRNNAVTVTVELHGSRHYDAQDLMRVGALPRDD